MRLLAEISGHGFGHLAQSAEVLNRFCARQPDVDLLIRTTAPLEVVHTRIDVPFEFVEGGSDFGMKMLSALEVDITASCQAYELYHRDWDNHITQLANWLKLHEIEAVFSNISYAILAAASHADIPSVALCSLNWAEVFNAYCDKNDVSGQIYDEMSAAYNSANCFICPQPSMLMPGLDNIVTTGPVARTGVNRRAEIVRKLGLSESTRLVMVTPGGIPTDMPVNQWPTREDIFWLVSWPLDSQREDISSRHALGMHFSDLLASSDIVLTKPGYGMVAETACTGRPVIIAPRGDWPEEPYLLAWLRQHTHVREVSRQQFLVADVLDEIDSLLKLPPLTPMSASGADEAAGIMTGCLKRHS